MRYEFGFKCPSCCPRSRPFSLSDYLSMEVISCRAMPTRLSSSTSQASRQRCWMSLLPLPSPAHRAGPGGDRSPRPDGPCPTRHLGRHPRATDPRKILIMIIRRSAIGSRDPVYVAKACILHTDWLPTKVRERMYASRNWPKSSRSRMFPVWKIRSQFVRTFSSSSSSSGVKSLIASAEYSSLHARSTAARATPRRCPEASPRSRRVLLPPSARFYTANTLLR